MPMIMIPSPAEEGYAHSLSRAPLRRPQFAASGLRRDRFSQDEYLKLSDYVGSRMRLSEREASVEQLALQVQAEVDGLNIAARTMIELELKERDVSTHSFDYDPFATGR